MRIFISSLVLMLGMIVVPDVSQSSPIGEPFAKRNPVTTQYHGISITDDYAWLKADSWQQALNDPSLLPQEIRNYLQAENTYFYEKMASVVPLQKILYQELIGRVVENDSTVPKVDNSYAYFWRDVRDKNYRILFRRPSSEFKSQETLFSLEPSRHDELILDTNVLAEGKASFTLGATKHTQNHQLLAYSPCLFARP